MIAMVEIRSYKASMEILLLVDRVSEEELFHSQMGKRNETRQVAMYLLTELCNKSLKEIARSFWY